MQGDGVQLVGSDGFTIDVGVYRRDDKQATKRSVQKESKRHDLMVEFLMRFRTQFGARGVKLDVAVEKISK